MGKTQVKDGSWAVPKETEIGRHAITCILQKAKMELSKIN